MRDQHDDHVAIAPQPVAATQEVEPVFVELDIALAKARALDRRPAAVGAQRRLYQRLELVEAIDD